jgi:hypothetical protein
MPTNDAIRNLIDSLIACDEQPSEEHMAELRKRLEQKVTRMKRYGRRALYICFAAAVLMLIGYAALVIAAGSREDVFWLRASGTGVLIAGAILAIVGCVGLFLYRGFGFLWARHDFQEVAITELSLQVERLSERLDKLSRSP